MRKLKHVTHIQTHSNGEGKQSIIDLSKHGVGRMEHTHICKSTPNP